MPKRLVVCCDGTWNTFGQKNPTNVVKIGKAVRVGVRDGVEQPKPLYVAGVGTKWWEKIGGGAAGFGLSKNLKEGYQDIVGVFEPGDEIFLFGFSRGAYTARSLAGFIRNCGILKREHRNRLEEGFALYRDRTDETKPDAQKSIEFRAKYSHESGIRFIGVWDTVGSLGIPIKGRLADKVNQRWAFHDVKLSNSVEAAYHALAIDEKRGPFEPTLWKPMPGRKETQSLEQVWFSGVHCNVGGGYASSELSDIPLIWMMQQARNHGLVLADDPDETLPASGSRATPLVIADVVAGYLAKTNAFAKLDESRKGLYKLLDLVHRPLGATDVASEHAASSAIRRLEIDPTYRPTKLVEYRDRKGAVRAVDYRPKED
ncbi:DUF2235 domain-containing protein [Gordonia rhizosphera]|uniref:T6SS Phospholipase effector Tle1-like catalytic domain-containing protein n=1 Tax=Gordonia rhizosphera NBRC 16068 TaxID=1108045 RepID=K6WCL1_9ACTN|nr:DUF2235 domain-containing protein [Gordonia rhizosphera]GAB91471.1 hypothetical protein GORHZ_135_00200 [Gordonia rhizosphera NBRC 16068]